MEAYRERAEGELYPLITLTLGGNGHLHAQAALSPGKEPLMPLDMSLGGAQFGEQKMPFARYCS